jgi:amidase
MEPETAAFEDSVGAFLTTIPLGQSGSASGTLAGRTLAVKDLFDVAGAVTGFGNPDWAASHPPAVATAPVVLALLEAGARLVGKTKTVELAYGLTGENVWYGTPLNPRAPDRFPGGSSCGSAAAVAAGLADIGLGSDTGGSVRIPASYCGLFGIRPTHAAISLAGACALAPSLDTPGWFTRDATLLAQVGRVLLPEAGPTPGTLGPLLRFEEAWESADFDVVAALLPALQKLTETFGPAVGVRPLPEGPAALYRCHRLVQGQEAWTTLGGWVETAKPMLSEAVQRRLAAAREVTEAEAAEGRSLRRRLSARLRAVLAGGGVLAFPTSPVPAPLLTSTAEQQEIVRERTGGITSLSSQCGLPEVSLPAATLRGAPLGLSFAAAPGYDRALLSFAQHAAAALGI